MTIIVVGRVDEGIVVAADSAVTHVSASGLTTTYDGEKVFRLTSHAPMVAATVGQLNHVLRDIREVALNTIAVSYQDGRWVAGFEDGQLIYRHHSVRNVAEGLGISLNHGLEVAQEVQALFGVNVVPPQIQDSGIIVAGYSPSEPEGAVFNWRIRENDESLFFQTCPDDGVILVAAGMTDVFSSGGYVDRVSRETSLVDVVKVAGQAISDTAAHYATLDALNPGVGYPIKIATITLDGDVHWEALDDQG